MRLRPLLLSLLGLLGCARATAPETPPALLLVETAPTETSLGGAHPATHEVWLDMIQHAQRSVDLAQFYVVDEAPSRLTPVVEALREAAARGVKVRILADSRFHRTYPELLDSLGATPGFTLRLFDGEALGGGVHHAKYILVDDADLYVGSANFDWRSLEHIHELGLRVREPGLVGAYTALFAIDWARVAGEPAPSFTLAPFPVALSRQGLTATPSFSPASPSPDPALAEYPRLVAMVDGAQRSVHVQLMSLETVDRYSKQPLGELEAALRRAADRGVEVQILLADWSKRAENLAQLQELVRSSKVQIRLVTVPQHSAGFIPFARVIHAKYMTVDGESSWLGTSNWSWGYFNEGRNAGVLVQGAPFAQELEAIFGPLWASNMAETLDPDKVYEAPRIKE